MKYYFLALVFLIVGCSKNFEKSFSEAEELIKKNDYKSAVEILKDIADGNDEKYSPSALSKLGVIYQQNSLPLINYTESQKIAQKYFYQVYERFPNSDLAPKSLFMSAYILANELKQFDEATKQYKLFLEKYPNDQLAASAKIEIEYIGLSPEEILKKKTETSNAD